MRNATVIGVLGAGVMGTGIAQRFASYGYKILLIDLSKEILDKSYSEINRSLRIQNMVSKENIDVEDVISRISLDINYQVLAQADIVIENIPEVVDLKKEVYREIDKICKEGCVFLANTSCIPIVEIASFTNRKEKVIGAHFMNPVPMKGFVEVIRSGQISDETIRIVTDLLYDAEMQYVIVNDSPGFVSNRLSHLLMNEAANLVYEKVATPEQIDEIFVKGFRHAMGPLQTADLIGIDTVVNSIDVLYQYYQDSRFLCSKQLRKMVESNELGRKSGKGFYEY